MPLYAAATDAAQIQELILLGEFAEEARDYGVQVMNEGPGHVPLNEVEANVILAKELCGGAPFYVLGSLVSDIAPGYDHITAAIGGALAARAGADYLCVVTPAEHLRLPYAADIRDGLMAARRSRLAGYEFARHRSRARPRRRGGRCTLVAAIRVPVLASRMDLPIPANNVLQRKPAPPGASLSGDPGIAQEPAAHHNTITLAPIVCLDMEGVLFPEIWGAIALRFSLPTLNLTTRECANYDELMSFRLGVPFGKTACAGRISKPFSPGWRAFPEPKPSWRPSGTGLPW